MEKYEGFEIDRDALRKELISMILTSTEHNSWDIATDIFISKMPLWLKRIEDK